MCVNNNSTISFMIVCVGVVLSFKLESPILTSASNCFFLAKSNFCFSNSEKIKLSINYFHI